MHKYIKVFWLQATEITTIKFKIETTIKLKIEVSEKLIRQLIKVKENIKYQTLEEENPGEFWAIRTNR